MTKVRAMLGAAVAALLVGSTTLVLADGGPPAVYVSATGNDAAACTQAAPCKTFSRGYQAAQAGATVQVAAGNYPQQNIKGTSKSSLVTFVPAGVVTVGCSSIGTVGNGTIQGASCIDVYVSHIAFDGGPNKNFRTQTYTVNGFSYQGRLDTERGTDDVQFLNMDAGSFTAAATHMKVIGNDFGPSVDPLNNLIVEDAPGAVVTDNLIHDYLIENGGHFECMYWQGVVNVTLAYNEFRSCAVYGIHSKEGTTFSSKGVTVDHNVFWNPRNLTTQADVQLTTEILPCSGSTVTNNVFTDGLIDECSPTTDQPNTFRAQSDPPPVSPIRVNPPPPPPPPPVTTTTPTTTVVPPPAPPAYHPACEPTCDADLAAANDKNSALEAKVAALKKAIDDFTAAVAAAG